MNNKQISNKQIELQYFKLIEKEGKILDENFLKLNHLDFYKLIESDYPKGFKYLLKIAARKLEISQKDL